VLSRAGLRKRYISRTSGLPRSPTSVSYERVGTDDLLSTQNRHHHRRTSESSLTSRPGPHLIQACSSLAVFDLRVSHTVDVLSPFISILCHSDWLLHGESCPRLDVVQPGRVWSCSPACTWHCSLHYLFRKEFFIGNVLYKTKSLDDTKPNINPKTNPNTNPIQLFYNFWAPSHVFKLTGFVRFSHRSSTLASLSSLFPHGVTIVC